LQLAPSFGLYQGRPVNSAGIPEQANQFWLGWCGYFYYRGLRRAHAHLDGDGFNKVTRHQAVAGGGSHWDFAPGRSRRAEAANMPEVAAN
jgi:hypothetical protein